jgi:hypothetical protein
MQTPLCTGSRAPRYVVQENSHFQGHAMTAVPPCARKSQSAKKTQSAIRPQTRPPTVAIASDTRFAARTHPVRNTHYCTAHTQAATHEQVARSQHGRAHLGVSFLCEREEAGAALQQIMEHVRAAFKADARRLVRAAYALEQRLRARQERLLASVWR